MWIAIGIPCPDNPIDHESKSTDITYICTATNERCMTTMTVHEEFCRALMQYCKYRMPPGIMKKSKNMNE